MMETQADESVSTVECYNDFIEARTENFPFLLLSNHSENFVRVCLGKSAMILIKRHLLKLIKKPRLQRKTKLLFFLKL